MGSCSRSQPKSKAASAKAQGYFKPRNSQPPSRKGYGLLTRTACRAGTAVIREKSSVQGRWDQYSWKEDTKTRAGSAPVPTWALTCLPCLEMYTLQNSRNCVWKRNAALSSVHPLSYPLQHILSRHLPYQFFVFSSLSLLNTNVIYYVPILNSNLKKFRCLSDSQVNETVFELKKGCDVIT